MGSISRSRRSSGGGNGNTLQCSWLEKFHGQRSLAGYSPRGHKDGARAQSQDLRLHPLPHLQQPLVGSGSVSGS